MCLLSQVNKPSSSCAFWSVHFIPARDGQRAKRATLLVPPAHGNDTWVSHIQRLETSPNGHWEGNHPQSSPMHWIRRGIQEGPQRKTYEALRALQPTVEPFSSQLYIPKLTHTHTNKEIIKKKKLNKISNQKKSNYIKKRCRELKRGQHKKLSSHTVLGTFRDYIHK